MSKITILILVPTYITSIKIYKSELPLSANTSLPIGLHYIKQENEKVAFSNSITFCARINYKRLGQMDYSLGGASRIFHIKGPSESGHSWYDAFLWVDARYPNTWIGFGNSGKPMSYSNWILYEPIKREFRLD